MRESAISYRQLLERPNVLALLAATGLSRLASHMFGLTIVFHALAVFGSPTLAGWMSFAAMAPGLMVSPLAGAFLDRAGAVRGIAADLAVSALVALTLTVLVHMGWAPPWVLLALAALYALTSPLSAAGIRVVLPRLVPSHVLDRANALDTAIHGAVSVAGPSLAGLVFGFGGSTWAFGTICTAYAGAALCIWAIQESARPPRAAEGFLAQAWEGLGYVVRRPLLRGLAAGYTLNMVTWGILVVTVPVTIAGRFEPGRWETVAGMIWAITGATGGLGALIAGQARIQGREVPVMIGCMLVSAAAAWPLAGTFGLPGLCVGLAITGLMAGPIDVSLLTLRQRKTEPGRLGRVLAVSMSLNMAGFPIGTALGGSLAAWSPALAFLAAAAASLLAAAATWALIPAEDAGS